MAEDRLGLLHKATISYDYLHTNSTTHEFIFGAVAELTDNSADANAKKLTIDVDDPDGDPRISILDDGDGMSREEAISVMTFGHSWKKMEQGLIGKYGNGLKSGAMRLAKDFIIFTKRNGICTCVMLSRTFHEESNVKDVLLPSPSFDANNRHMFTDNEERHLYEVELIYQHSPYNDKESLFQQFNRIGESGTLIVLYNLRRIENGQFELDFNSRPDDIRLANYEIQREEERNSLRAYLSVLYLNPRMKIYLRGVKVATVRILATLLQPYKYKFLARNLKEAASNAYDQCVRNTKEAKDLLCRAKSDLGEFSDSVHRKQQRSFTEKNTRIDQRLLQIRLSECEEKVRLCEERELQAKKAKSSPSPLNFFFGLNIHHRNRYGCMFYNNGRLIDMYVKPQVQKEKNDILMKLLGVVGIVDIPYSVLEPTHNKQSFANKREFQYILKNMGEEMENYWTEINISKFQEGGIRGYWKQFGYTDSSWFSTCSNSVDDQRRRFQRTGYALQCDRCLKWRHLSFQSSFLENGAPLIWECKEHPNTKLATCSIPEEEAKAKEGRSRPKQESKKDQVISPIAKPPLAVRKSVDANPPSSWNGAKQDGVMSKILGDQIAREQNGGRLPPQKSTKVFDSLNQAVDSPLPPRSAKTRPPIVETDEDADDEDFSEKRRAKKRPSVTAKLPIRITTKRTSGSENEAEDEVRGEKRSQSTRPLSSATDKPVIAEGKSLGVSPMKRFKQAVCIADRHTDEEEIIVSMERPRKPKTKAELRLLLSKSSERLEEQKSLMNEKNIVPPTNGSTDSSLGLKILTDALEEAKSQNEALLKELNLLKSTSSQKYEILERDNDKWKSVSHLFVNYFIEKGVTYAHLFKGAKEERIREMDVANFLDNIWNEIANDTKPTDLDGQAVLQKIKMTYSNPNELVTDLHKVMTWAFESQKDNLVSEGQEFIKLKELATLL